jgi:hypothetical protein
MLIKIKLYDKVCLDTYGDTAILLKLQIVAFRKLRCDRKNSNTVDIYSHKTSNITRRM